MHVPFALWSSGQGAYVAVCIWLSDSCVSHRRWCGMEGNKASLASFPSCTSNGWLVVFGVGGGGATASLMRPLLQRRNLLALLPPSPESKPRLALLGSLSSLRFVHASHKNQRCSNFCPLSYTNTHCTGNLDPD